MADDTAASTTRDPAVADAGRVTPAGILSQLYIANTTEIELANLAAKQATSPEVRRIARKLATDHGKNREQLRALAQKLSVSLDPSAVGNISAADSAAPPPELQNRSGSDFDRALLVHEIKEHRKNIEKIRSQLLPAAPNDQVKTYLQKTLSEMQDHLADLEQVQEQISS
jgi:predicted outer membrane protein